MSLLQRVCRPNGMTWAATIAAGFSSAILPLSAATLYISLDSPDPTPPDTNWSTAAHVIQDGVDAAQSNDLVPGHERGL